MVIECGVTQLGLPLALGYHEPDLTESQARTIVRKLGDRATFFLITYLDAAEHVAALCHALEVSTVQLHGSIALDEVAALRASWPSLRIIKSLIVEDGNLDALSDDVSRFAPLVDAFITDTLDPKTGATGATGRAHEWNVSRALTLRSPKPVILAGGLRPDNVAAAIEQVRPAGVDVHTGVEASNGRKDRDKVEAFVIEARRAFDSTNSALFRQ